MIVVKNHDTDKTQNKFGFQPIFTLALKLWVSGFFFSIHKTGQGL